MKMRTVTAAALALSLAAASLALAQPGPRAPEAPAPRWDRLCDTLDLSDAQQEAIDGIREKSREAGMQSRKEIVRLQNELDGLMLQDKPDAGAAEKLVRRLGELRTEQRLRRLQTRLAVRAQLTDTQRDRLIAGAGARMGRQGGHGRGPGAPHDCPLGRPGACPGPRERPSGAPGRGRS